MHVTVVRVGIREPIGGGPLTVKRTSPVSTFQGIRGHDTILISYETRRDCEDHSAVFRGVVDGQDLDIAAFDLIDDHIKAART